MDQTTHEGLYNLILSYFWNNKKRIDLDAILLITSDTSSEKLQKLIQLLKATLLMGKSPELKKAKNKLREMFYIELLTQSYPKLYFFSPS